MLKKDWTFSDVSASPEAVGARLKTIRTAAKLSQSDMAEILRVSDKSYKLYELGQRGISVETAALIANEFSVELNWLVAGDAKLFWTDDLVEFGSLIQKARDLYIAFEESGKTYTDVEHDELEQFRKIGNDLFEFGGGDAMSAAVKSFFPDEPYRIMAAGSALERFWNGVGNWRH